MARLDRAAPVQVRDGPADLQDAVVGARGEPQPVERLFQQRVPRVAQAAEFVQAVRRDPGVAGDPGAAEALVLERAGRVDPRADRRGALRRFAGIELFEFDGRDLDVQVQPVQQRAGDPGEVAGDRLRRAGAAPRGMPEIAAGARVHRRDEHGGARVADGPADAGDRHGAVFDRLAQHLHRAA